MSDASYTADSVREFFYDPPLAFIKAMELAAMAEEDLPSPVLDLGCGEGGPARVLFAGRDAQVFGIDLSGVALLRAHRAGGHRGLTKASMYDLPFSDATFGSAISVCVLEHVADLHQALASIARVLQPGGRFVATVPSIEFRDLLAGVQRARARGREYDAEAYARAKDERLVHLNYYTPDEWAELFAQHSLTLDRWRCFASPRAIATWDRLDTIFSTPFGAALRKHMRTTRGIRRLARSWPVRKTWEGFFAWALAERTDGRDTPGGVLVLSARRNTADNSAPTG